MLRYLDDGCHLGFNHFEQKKTSLIYSHSTWGWQPSCNSTILDSAILHKKTSLIHSDSTWLMAAILNSAIVDSATAILDSDTLLSSLRFTQKHSHSTLTLTQTNSIWLHLDSISAILNKTLTQTNSIWLKLIHSDSTWWSAILNSAILDFAILNRKKTSVIHSHSTSWWQPSWILPSWIQPFCTKTHFTHSFWLILIQPVWFTHLFWLNFIMQPSWILPCCIQTLPS